MIDFDVETTGLQPYSGTQRAFMYQFLDDAGTLEVLRPETDAERIQGWLYRGVHEGIRAHNARFDRAFAEQAGFNVPGDGCWHDSMIVAHAVDERKSVALKSLADRLGLDGTDHQKAVRGWLTEERKRRKKAAQESNGEFVQPTFADVPEEIMRPYAAEDVVLTRKVSAQFDPVVANSADLRGIVEFERDVLDALYAVEQRGFPADRNAYHELELHVVERLEELEDSCKRLAGSDDFNPNSSQQLYRALKERGADLRFVTGQSMDAENLATVDDELARSIEQFRAEYKVLSTYIRPLIHRHYDSKMMMTMEPFVSGDGRVHASYRQVGARTGRMSCSMPNIQNQPRDDLRLRYNFVAEPGKVFVACDLDSIEMAIFAAYTGEGKLIETIREGGDPHTLTAEMLGIRDRARAGGHVESARQRGKTFNFSVIYGGGLRTIRKQQRCSQDEARLLRNRYYKAYPEVRRLQARVDASLAQRGYIKSAWGRRYRCDDVQREGYRFVNYLVQGTAADLLKASLIRMHREGIPVVALVHDEAIALVDESDAEEVRHAMIEAMTEHPRITEKVPLRAEGKIVKRWSEAKDPDFAPAWAKDVEGAAV